MEILKYGTRLRIEGSTGGRCFRSVRPKPPTDTVRSPDRRRHLVSPDGQIRA
jgi:hypothetical protein